jgi:hypothetical protein
MTFEMLRSPVTFLKQMLDGLEAMERKEAHRLLFEHLAPTAVPQALEEMATRVEDHLTLPTEEREGNVERVFHDLAVFTADALMRKLEETAGC